MSIKLIFGNNGDGKSFYSEQLIKGSSLVIDSQISNWYDEDKKIISEFNFKSKDKNEEIKEYSKSLISAKSSLSKIPGFKFNTFKSFLKTINFSTIEEWDNYIAPEDQTIGNTSIPEIIDLYTFISDNKAILSSITSENQELLVILSSLSTYEIDNEYKTKTGININETIKNILIDIKAILLDNDVDCNKFKDFKFKDLNRLFTSLDKIPELTENLANEIKNIVVNSHEYSKIKELKKEIKK